MTLGHAAQGAESLLARMRKQMGVTYGGILLLQARQGWVGPAAETTFFEALLKATSTAVASAFEPVKVLLAAARCCSCCCCCCCCCC